MAEVMRLTGMTHAMIYDGVRAKTFPKWTDRQIFHKEDRVVLVC
jgi:hypothetical protein